jgi:hypothetical protein
VRTRKILACDNAAVDPRVNRESCRALGIASFVVLPLIRENDVIGIFEVFSSQPHAFQERDLQALERLGEMVNTALDQVTRPRSRPAAVANATHKIPVVPNNSQTKPAAPPAVPKAVTETMLTTLLPRPEPEQRLEKEEVADSSAPDAQAKGTPAIGTCASCGFPVSPGRAFCLDCEAALPEKFGDKAPAQKDAPAFLTDLADGGPQPPGFKHWVIAHRYLLGIVLVLGGTAALLLLR